MSSRSKPSVLPRPTKASQLRAQQIANPQTPTASSVASESLETKTQATQSAASRSATSSSSTSTRTPTSSNSSTINKTPKPSNSSTAAKKAATPKSPSSSSSSQSTPKASTTKTTASKTAKPNVGPSSALKNAIAAARASQATAARMSNTRGEVEAGADEFDAFSSRSKLESSQTEEKFTGTVGALAMEQIVKQARTSGRLNISNKNLSKIPDVVWNMYHTDVSKLSMDFSSSGTDAAWYETVDLQRFVAADNSISELDERMGEEFMGLLVIDLHNNMLTSLPKSFANFQAVTILNLSSNQFTAIPAEISKLTTLVDLQLVGNKISGSLDPSIGNLVKLEHLNLSDNSITLLPDTMSQLRSLRRLNISNNKLIELPAMAWKGLNGLKELDASDNKLRTAFTLMDNEDSVKLDKLERLSLRNNQLQELCPRPTDTSISSTLQLPALRELMVAQNNLKDLAGLLYSTPKLQIIDLGRNQLSSLPEGLLDLSSLERLDISSNAFKELPAQLGQLQQLKVLTWTGNPIRNVPKSTQGTSDLLKLLRERLAGEVTNEIDETPTIIGGRTVPVKPKVGSSPSKIPPQSQQNISTRTLDLARQKMAELSEEDLSSLNYTPTNINLSHNLFTAVPPSLGLLADTLTHLILTWCKFTSFNLTSPMVLPNLQTLDLSNNLIASLDLDESRPPSYPKLNTLTLNTNKLTELPIGLSAAVPNLTALLVNTNSIKTLNPASLQSLQLEVLDAGNNDIGYVPPELSLIKSLKNLALDGNSFRVPRRAILEKGTVALMEYLRGQLE